MPTAKEATYIRRPIILSHNGRSLHVDRISRQQEFLRQPLCDEDFKKPGLIATAYITRTMKLTTEEMDDLLLRLAEKQEFLRGKGGHVFGVGPLAGGLLGVECKAPGHPTLLTNSEGDNSAFYIAEPR